jgi:hypothetical protein
VICDYMMRSTTILSSLAMSLLKQSEVFLEKDLQRLGRMELVTEDIH